MDTTIILLFNIHINYHIVVNFLKCGPGMYYFDTANYKKSPVNFYSLLSTVKEKKSHFSLHEIKGADRAHGLQEKLV